MVMLPDFVGGTLAGDVRGTASAAWTPLAICRQLVANKGSGETFMDMRRIGRAVALGLMSAWIAGQAVAQSAAVKHEVWAVQGLAAPAQMVVDRWGVPH